MTVRGFAVATTCATVEEFIERYHTRCDEGSIFVGIVEERVLGTECAFAILLANRQPVFAGICEVLEIFPNTNNPYQRRGMRLGIRKLGVSSEQVFAEMAAARLANKRRFARGSAAPPEHELIPEIEIDEAVTDDAIPVDIDDAPFAER